jgi:hypothetical protein
MARRKADGEVIFIGSAPPGLRERLQRVAGHNRRSMADEAVVALERYVKSEEARLRREGIDLDKGEV